MKFYVEELNIKADGTDELSVYHRDTEEAAWKLYFQKCSTNVDNSGNVNSLICIKQSNGIELEHKVFEHPAEEPVAE